MSVSPVALRRAGRSIIGFMLLMTMLAPHAFAHNLPDVFHLFPNLFGDLLVAQDSEILRYNGRTGEPRGVLIPSGAGGLDNVQGITIGPDGKLYMSSFGSQNDSSSGRGILRYDGKDVEVFIPAGSGGMGAPNDVAFGPDGNLYVADGFFGTSSILRFNGKTGEFMGVFASGGGMQQPNRIAFGPTGDLYVGNATSSDVLRYHRDTGLPFPAEGQSGAIFVPGAQGPVNTVVAVAPDGTLMVASSASTDVHKYDGRTGVLLGIAVPDIGDVTDMAFGPDGNLYITSYFGSAVFRYRGTSGQFLDAFVPGGSGGISRPNSLVFSCVPVLGITLPGNCVDLSAPREVSTPGSFFFWPF